MISDELFKFKTLIVIFRCILFIELFILLCSVTIYQSAYQSYYALILGMVSLKSSRLKSGFFSVVVLCEVEILNKS